MGGSYQKNPTTIVRNRIQNTRRPFLTLSMDSLLASYVSSDDEDNVVEEEKKASAPAPKTSLFASSLPPPQASSSSSLFSSLPPPKSLSAAPPSHPAHTSRDLGGENDERGRKPTAKNPLPYAPPSKPPSSSIFSSLPPPKTSASSSFFSSLPPPKSSRQSNSPQTSNPASLDQNPKQVVQFTLPLNPSVLQNRNFDEDDDEEEEKDKKKSKDSSSAASKALSSMLPSAKNSLCLAPAAASAASRRSVVEADVPVENPEGIGQQQEMSGFESYGGYYDGVWVGGPVETGAEGAAVTIAEVLSAMGAGVVSVIGLGEAWITGTGGTMDYGSYGGNLSDGSVATAAPEVTHMGRIVGEEREERDSYGSCGGEAG